MTFQYVKVVYNRNGARPGFCVWVEGTSHEVDYYDMSEMVTNALKERMYKLCRNGEPAEERGTLLRSSSTSRWTQFQSREKS